MAEGGYTRNPNQLLTRSCRFQDGAGTPVRFTLLILMVTISIILSTVTSIPTLKCRKLSITIITDYSEIIYIIIYGTGTQ